MLTLLTGGGRLDQTTTWLKTITKAIIDAHQGSITVKSTEGKHSTFRVQLPETQKPTAVRSP